MVLLNISILISNEVDLILIKSTSFNINIEIATLSWLHLVYLSSLLLSMFLYHFVSMYLLQTIYIWVSFFHPV